MIRMLVRLAVFLASAAVGILAAAAILDRFEVHVGGFISAVVVFAVLQMVLTPFLMKVAAKNASAFVGGVGLVSTFVALLIATFVTDGLTIRGVTTWVLSSLIVWLVTALATLLLPVLFVKAGVEQGRGRGGSST